MQLDVENLRTWLCILSCVWRILPKMLSKPKASLYQVVIYSRVDGFSQALFAQFSVG